MAGGVLRGCHPVPRDRLLVRMTFPIHSQFVDKRQGPCFTNTVDPAPPQAHGRPQVRSLIEASPAARGFGIRLVASLLCPVRSRKLEPRGYQGLEMSVMKGTSGRSPDPFIDEDIGARRCDVTGQGPSVRQRLSGATSGLVSRPPGCRPSPTPGGLAATRIFPFLVRHRRVTAAELSPGWPRGPGACAPVTCDCSQPTRPGHPLHQAPFSRELR